MKSFLFKLVHQLLPSKEKIHRLTLTSSPLCWCESGDHENYLHLFYFCSKNREAGEAVLRVAQAYDRNLTAEKSLRLEVQTDEVFTLPTTSILSTGLLFIWENRKQRKKTTLYMMRAELESAVSIRRRSRLKNLINNFF